MESTKETEDDITPRAAKEVSERVLAVLATIGKVHFPEENAKWVEKENIFNFLSPTESEFLSCQTPSEEDQIKFSWRAEALASLVWSLSGLEEMPPFNDQFDPFINPMVLQAIRETESFLRDSKIRPENEIDEMESFLYHQHWRVRDHELGFGMDQPEENDPDISDLNPGIVYERRYGMSWVAGFGEGVGGGTVAETGAPLVSGLARTKVGKVKKVKSAMVGI